MTGAWRNNSPRYVWFQRTLFSGKFCKLKSPPFPYVWFNENITSLAEFLNKQLESPEVEEVVILGDLFDRWIIPTDEDPLTDFQAIYNNRR